MLHARGCREQKVGDSGDWWSTRPGEFIWTLNAQSAEVARLRDLERAIARQVSTDGYPLLRCRMVGGSSIQAPGEPSSGCVYGLGLV